MKNWSPYQESIFDFGVNGEGNAIIEAVAGSGKTTTMVEMIRRIHGKNVIFLAFNKSIADELKSRGVNARTFHSLVFSPVLKSRGAKAVTQDKLDRIIENVFSGQDRRMYGFFCKKLVGLARQAGIGCLIPGLQENWMDLVQLHDIELENEDATVERGIELASQLLSVSNGSSLVDFDDLLYFSVKDGISLQKFDMVVVDEAQDTNAIQRAILRKIMHKGSRLIAVGDPAQAIYGFRGADSESMNLIAAEFDCKRLPLTVSYRCPTSVIEHARKWVSHIEAAPNAQAGSVQVKEDWSPADFRVNDLVVSRTVKPMIELAYRCIQSRVPVQVMGRDIGQGLKSLIKKMNTTGIDRLIAKLNEYTKREVEKAIAKRKESLAESIQDKTDSVLFLIGTLGENERTVPALERLIDSLFDSKVESVKLSTIHKAKGLEAKRVWWLNHESSQRKMAFWARQEWQKQSERNLCYVAVTRSMDQLFLIEQEER